MKTIISSYKTYLLRRGLMEKTIEYYTWHIRRFFEETKCEIGDFGDLRKFTKRYDCIILRQDICNEGKKKHLKCARRFGDFLLEEGYIDCNVARSIRAPRVQTHLPIPLEDSEIADIFSAIKKRWSGALAYRNEIIIKTFLHTGIRRSELLNLRRNQIFLDHIFIRSGKGSKDRVVYLTTEFSSILQKYIKMTSGVSEYVFFSARSEKLSVRALSRIFEILKEKTGMKKLHAHRMRHTYGGRFAEKLPTALLRDQLGHASIATTNIYITVRNSYRKEQIGNMNMGY